MSPQTQNGVWVSDEESGEEQEIPLHEEKPSVFPFWKQRAKLSSLPGRLRRLTRVGIRGNTRPSVGQLCLVMVGRAEHDQGQMGIVSRQTACMVEVSNRAKDGTHAVSHLKRPSSLVVLEPGLVLIHEKNGSVWIRHDPHEIVK